MLESEENSPQGKKGQTQRKFRILLVFTLIVLTVQAWAGDVVNIFFVPAAGISPPPYSFSGFIQGIESLNEPLLYWHAFEGIFLLALGVAVLVLSFKWSKARSVRISSILGLVYVVLAALGGYLFVLSGFLAGGYSIQMGGSFLATYAFYFIALYYSK